MKELKTTVRQAIEQLDNVVAEETYNAWDLWEESMETVKRSLKETKAERAYKVKWIEDTYVTWLSTYKHNHYVPYKFLIKYFK